MEKQYLSPDESGLSGFWRCSNSGDVGWRRNSLASPLHRVRGYGYDAGRNSMTISQLGCGLTYVVQNNSTLLSIYLALLHRNVRELPPLLKRTIASCLRPCPFFVLFLSLYNHCLPLAVRPCGDPGIPLESCLKSLDTGLMARRGA